MKNSILIHAIIFAVISALIVANVYKKETYKNISIEVQKDNPITESVLKDKIIVIDAGHGLNNDNSKEPIAPSSNELKPAFVSGTSGKHLTEEQLNLKVSLIVEKMLIDNGATVRMTRYTNSAYMSNVERAKFANDLGADAVVRIHADGSENSEEYGLSVLVPDDTYVNTDVYVKSNDLGIALLNNLISTTDAKNNGIVKRDDLSGFNWSNVPVALVEMGFMTNIIEEENLSNDDYQYKIAQGIVQGLNEYFLNETYKCEENN